MNELKGSICNKNNISGRLNNKEVTVYPELEDLKVTFTNQEQKFKSKKYGYETVTVQAIESEKLDIIPTKEGQKFNGLYDEVSIAGEENLVSSNIKNGVQIFNVVGNAKVSNIEIQNAKYLFYEGSRIENMQEILKLCKGVIDSSYMFCKCDNLTELNLSTFDTSEIENMTSMFSSCNQLTNINISNFDTSKVRSMNSMFYDCGNLRDLDLSGFDASKVENVRYTFDYCGKLTNFKIMKNIGKSFSATTSNFFTHTLSFAQSPKLTHESLINIIENIYDLNLSYDVANGGTLYRQKLALGSTNLAKLTEEEIKIATNKGWNVM